MPYRPPDAHAPLWLISVWLAALAPSPSCAGEAGPDSLRVTLEAQASVWWTLYEQVENGLHQTGSLEPAADAASGFNFRQGRLGLRFQALQGRAEALVRLRLEERTDVLDFWAGWRAAPGWSLAVGQQKIPSTAEVLCPDEELDFITRSTLGSRLGDLALSRTPYISSVMAVKSYDRDLGLALRGVWPAASSRLGLFAMVGNGLGAGNYIGGSESSEFLYTNTPGDWYYGGRLEWRPLSAVRAREPLVLGCHGSLNRHRNAALDARGPVFDLDRRVWSLDLGAAPRRGMRGGAFFGAGRLDDNWTGQRYRYAFQGWGLWWLWAPRGGPLEMGVRRDEFKGGFQPVDDSALEGHWTLGLNWRADPALRLQLNYLHKESASAGDPDLADDILYLNLQSGFRAVLDR